MTQDRLFAPSESTVANALIDNSGYQAMYDASIADPEAFWAEHGKRIDWIKPYSQVSDVSYDKADLHISWFGDGTLNAAANCLDRHLAGRGDQTAIIWEGDDPADSRYISYAELHEEVCKFANVLKAEGAKKGDRITIYMPMIPEATVAMLACARIGAVHSVVFGGFSPDALAGRIQDCDSNMVITADEGLRGGRPVPLKANTDAALESCPDCNKVVVVRRTGGDIGWVDGRDVWYHEAMADASADCPPEEMNAEDPMFILYTSGSTGKPKGVLHTTGGYMVYASMTHQYVFDYKDGDVYWCTADVGWVTGHSYIVYGPLANGATTLMFEGVPTYPDAGRFWAVCEKYKVNQFYTAPTAIRALIRQGDEFVTKHDLSSLKTLGTVGEPINPDVWMWYYNLVGGGRCPIVDTWWQTETGGHMITALPGAIDMKPGSASRPFFGVEPLIVDDQGNEVADGEPGKLCIKKPWPGIMRTTWGDHSRFINTYFSTYPGMYFTGDGARKDLEGDYWLLGRVDDVINISGHRLGTAEVESALVSHFAVAEAAVVGCPHEIKGQGIHAYVTLKSGIEGTDELKAELVKTVRDHIGPIASPDVIQWAPSLPKTRSGKIMRRILRKIAEGESDKVGDISTLADPSVVADLIENSPE